MISALLELHGHLIDSLLLAKVIDRIQMSGYDYVLADLRVGTRKQDLSTAQITVWVPSSEDLELLLQELRIHGVHLVANEEATFAPVLEAGRAPAGAYLRHLPASQVLHHGQWISVEGTDSDWAIVLKGAGAALVRVENLEAGEKVLVGQQGLRWLAKGKL